MKTHWTASNIPTQAGRQVLITGANSGIEAALELARHGAEVILPARTIEKANDAVAGIKVQVPGAVLCGNTGSSGPEFGAGFRGSGDRALSEESTSMSASAATSICVHRRGRP